MTSSSSDPADERLDALFADSNSWAQMSSSLKRIARSIVGDHATADDVVQSAWLHALEREDSGHGIGWLRKVVRSRSIDTLRRRSREQPSVGIEAAAYVAQGEGGLKAKLDVQRQIIDAVDALHEPYRTAVYLRYFEGLGSHAIATRLQVPHKTIQTRLTRAHGELRERLRTRLQVEGRWSMALLGFADIHVQAPPLPIALTATTILMKKTASIAIAAVCLLAGWAAITSIGGGSAASSERVLDADVGRPQEQTAELQVAALADFDRELVVQPAHQAESVAPVLLERGSLRVKVLRASGAPAPEVHVIATTAHASQYMQRTFRQQTDAAGIAFFPQVPIGGLSITSDRDQGGRASSVEIRPGEMTETTLSIPPGIHVTGFARDALMRPVADAGIWLTTSSSSWAGGAIVTHTDAAGRFEIQDVPAGQSVGALAAGLQPSALVDLDEVDTSVVPIVIELVLSAGGAQLEGVVRDEHGQPVEEVLIALGSDPRLNWRTDGTLAESWTPRTARTGANGRYVFAGLESGEHDVQARSLEHALWSGSVELASGDNAELDITLSRGVVVRGTVTSAEGGVLSGATVLVFHDPVSEAYLQGGQVNYAGAFANPACITDEHGRYELRSVSTGLMSFYALAPRQPDQGARAVRRFATTQLELKSDTVATWSPVLADGRVIAGRTLYSDGTPITGVYVLLEGQSPSDGRVTYSEDGHFRFLNLGAGPYSLRVQMWTRPEGAPEPLVEGVYPGPEPIDLIATFAAPGEHDPSTVRVRLVDDVQRPGGETSVVIESSDANSWVRGESRGDAWTFKLDEPGTYRAVALHRDRRIWTGADFEVQAGERIDLPDLITGPGGTLVLAIQRPVDPAPTGLRAFLRRKPTRRAESFELGGLTELRIDHLEPGSGRISFLGNNIRQLELEFEITAGEETHLPVKLVPAVPVLYSIRWPSAAATGTMQIRITDRKDGAVADEFAIDDLTGYASPIRWNAYLAIGSYTFAVTKNGEPHYSEDFEVLTLVPKDAPSVGQK